MNKIIPKKLYGQNFLINNGIVEKILLAGELSKKDIVLEIGPGKGVLTERLVKYAKKVIAVEKDKRLYDFLEEKFNGIDNLELINADILEIRNQELETKDYKIIANIPYNITGKIFRKYLLAHNRPKMMILMVQKEVGERVLDKNKKSILSLTVELYGKAERVTNVSAGSFFPVPKVDSMVIKLIKGKKITEENKILGLIKIGFSQKRKKLISNLFNNLRYLSTGDKYNKKIIKQTFGHLGFDENIRAEELSLNDWLKLAKLI